ncbi:MAG: MbnH family di-heme enzyme [Chloroflexota bacterium]
MRYLAILALAVAGIIRSPFLPVELTTIPAHELFYAALGAAQLMWAIYFLWQPKQRIAWLGILLAGGSLTVMLLSRLIDVPFTNTPVVPETVLVTATIADVLAFVTLFFYLGLSNESNDHPIWRTARIAFGSCAIVGTLIWSGAEIAEPYLPALAHDTINQFEVFDQLAMLSATDYAWKLPPGFPVPYVPADNPMTEAKVELGRYLFYDTQLSGNNTMSCASCHLPELAFTDGVALPVGSTGESHVRNSQTLTNIAYNSTFTWASPVLTEVERQIVIPLFGEFPVEMGITGNEAVVLERLREDPLYPFLFANAFPEAEDPLTYQHIVQSLSSFVRTMISGDSPYDRFVYQGNYEALSESALRGMDMFLSEQFECHHCHGGFNFTLSTRHANTTFEEQPFFNTGLYNIDGEGAYPRGNTGIFEVTGRPEDMGRFRPPTLRNVELTAPYMHDGSMATLEEVIRFYADGGRVIEAGPNAGDGRDNPFKSGFVPGFEITDQEMEDMLNFLHSLTDETFTTDPDFSDPFTP